MYILFLLIKVVYQMNAVCDISDETSKKRSGSGYWVFFLLHFSYFCMVYYFDSFNWLLINIPDLVE